MADDSTVQARFVADFSDLQAGGAEAASTVEAASAQMEAGFVGAAEGAAALETQATAAREALTATAAASAETSAGLDVMAGAAGVAKEALGALGVTLGIAAVIDLGESALASAAEIEHEADVLGLTSTALQAFTESAKLAHVEISIVELAIRRFNAAQGLAQQGTGAQAEAFKELGVSANLPAEAALPAVAAALLKITNTAEKSRLEVALFSRSGEELNPALEQWAQGADALTTKLEAMGLMLDPKTTKAAHDAEIALDTAFDRFQVAYTPGVVALTNALSDFLTTLEGANDADKSGLFYGPGGVVNLGGGSTTTVPDGADMRQQQAQKSEAATAKAWAPAKQVPDVDVEEPDIAALNQEAEAAQRAGEIQRRVTDEIAQAAEQLAEKRISAAEQANNFELQMGDESLDQWKAKAIEEANAKYDAELTYLQKKAAADKGNVVDEQKDLDQIAALHQEHANQLATIDQQYAEKKRAIDQQELADSVKADEDELRNKISALDAELKSHQITDQQKYNQEMAFVSQTAALVNQAYETALAGMDKESKAYRNLKTQELAAQQQFVRQAQQASDQLETEQAQKWTQLGNSIKSSFNSAIDGMLFQGKTFEQGMLQIAEGVLKAFVSMGLEIAESWIENQIRSLFQTETTQAAAATTEVNIQAGIAAATAYAQYAAFPPVADAMAGEAYAETLMWGMPKLATGAWELKSDMIAQLHQGEMVVPQNFAEGMRSGRGMGAGETHFNTNYSPSISARDPTTIRELIRNNHTEFVGEMRRLARNGALR